MLRGNWSVILAAFGWLILSAASPEKTAPPAKNDASANQIPDAAKTIASAISQTVKPPEKDGGCDKGKDQRQSDLCAQWKAADAARDAAEYSFWTLILSAIGTGLLIWTLRETRQTSRRELRAYVSVKVGAAEMLFGKGGITANFATISHNGGVTPAYDAVHFGFAAILPHDQANSELSKPRPIEEDGMNGGNAIHSGEDYPSESYKGLFIPIHLIELIAEGSLGIYVFGVVSYVDTFGTRRRTDYCSYLTGKDFSEPYNKCVRTGGKQGDLPMKWRIARFHNSAT